jgi:hypothetical protein
VQRRQALRIPGMHVGPGRQQARGDVGHAQRRGQHQHGGATGQFLFDRGAGRQQGADDVELTHAHRRRQGRGAAVRGQVQVGTARQQQVDHRRMAAAGRAQQGRAALRIDGIERQAEVEQPAHRVGIAAHRRRRQVGIGQRTARQGPDPPVEPVGQIAPAAGQGHAERRLAIGRTHVGRGAMQEQALQCGLAAQRRSQMQGGHAAAVTGFDVGAAFEQAPLQAGPPQADGQSEAGVAFGRCGKHVRAAFEQVQCQLFQPARAWSWRWQATRKRASPPAPAGDTPARRKVWIAATASPPRASAANSGTSPPHPASPPRPRAPAATPRHRRGGPVRVVQQAAELARGAQAGQRIEPSRRGPAGPRATARPGRGPAAATRRWRRPRTV